MVSFSPSLANRTHVNFFRDTKQEPPILHISMFQISISHCPLLPSRHTSPFGKSGQNNINTNAIIIFKTYDTHLVFYGKLVIFSFPSRRPTFQSKVKKYRKLSKRIFKIQPKILVFIFKFFKSPPPSSIWTSFENWNWVKKILKHEFTDFPDLLFPIYNILFSIWPPPPRYKNHKAWKGAIGGGSTETKKNSKDGIVWW